MKKASFSVLLLNLGTPDAPNSKSVRKYLREFLSDPRVVEMSKFVWFFILNLFVLTFRPKKSARLYQNVWTDAGSPLNVFMQKISKKLPDFLAAKFEQEIPVYYANTYGNPSVASLMKKIETNNILVLPLYPQNSGPTIGAAFDVFAKVMRDYRNIPNIRWISGYHDFEPYLDALANSINSFLKEHKEVEQVIFSYHGMPIENTQKGDNYADFCTTTTQKVAEKLNFTQEFYAQTYQSRFGPSEWLQPYTDEYLLEQAKNGKKTVALISPGFSVDCLETLEELAISNKELFCEAGGEELYYIPCLNDSEEHLQAITALIEKNIGDWL